ncbi:hypothetical protein H8356DRAFT_1339719 [Neocallimastix lanati (nom. inval.)]|nr:hypothetical protein H8356DRAFT_1339719 [Neocallimastix sp. JGI-2020a]
MVCLFGLVVERRSCKAKVGGSIPGDLKPPSNLQRLEKSDRRLRKARPFGDLKPPSNLQRLEKSDRRVPFILLSD